MRPLTFPSMAILSVKSSIDTLTARFSTAGRQSQDLGLILGVVRGIQLARLNPLGLELFRTTSTTCSWAWGYKLKILEDDRRVERVEGRRAVEERCKHVGHI